MGVKGREKLCNSIIISNNKNIIKIMDQNRQMSKEEKKGAKKFLRNDRNNLSNILKTWRYIPVIPI